MNYVDEDNLMAAEAPLPRSHPRRGRPAPQLTEEEALKAHRRAVNARLRELKRRVPEPAEGSILTWSRSFNEDRPGAGPDGTTRCYTYVALRAGDLWHLTGMDDQRYTWEELFDSYLLRADTGSVRFAVPARRAISLYRGDR